MYISLETQACASHTADALRPCNLLRYILPQSIEHQKCFYKYFGFFFYSLPFNCYVQLWQEEGTPYS